MSDRRADRNLLFGIMAIQIDFVDRDELVQAMHDWALAKDRSIGEILVANGALGHADRAMLDQMVDRHIEMHDSSVESSLSSVSDHVQLAECLSGITDPDLEQSLSFVQSLTEEPRTNRDQFEETMTMSSRTDSTKSRFRVIRKHAQGGLGRVSVALDRELNREVALKEIQDKYADLPESRLRFNMEAEVTGGLEHPGIVPVYSRGTHVDGRPYYAMRFVDGADLKEAIQAFHKSQSFSGKNRFESIEFRRLIGKLVDVCDTMEYAHTRGVIHRDIKPANIVVGKFGETLVVDWGMAKVMDDDSIERETNGAKPHSEKPIGTSGLSTETMTGATIGTPQFMSPEQAGGDITKLSPLSDIYSLGATLYFLLVGETPFEAKNVDELLAKVKSGDFKKPRQANPTIPVALEAVCLKAMSLEPSERYESAMALADEIDRWLANQSTQAMPETSSRRFSRWLVENQRSAIGTVGLFVIGLCMIGLYSIGMSSRAASVAMESQRDTQEAYDESVATIADLETQIVSSQERELTARNNLLEMQRIYELGQERAHDMQPDAPMTRTQREMDEQLQAQQIVIQELNEQTESVKRYYMRSLNEAASLSLQVGDVEKATRWRRDLLQLHLDLGVIEQPIRGVSPPAPQ